MNWVMALPNIVYIGFPIDLMSAEFEVSEADLKPLQIQRPKNPEKTQAACLKFVLQEIERAKKPVIIVDACAIRNEVQADVERLMDKTGFPTYVAPMGKGAVHEAKPNYRGCYAGTVSLEQVAEEVQQADLILEIGSLQSDFNTGGFSYNLDMDKIIAFHTGLTSVFHATFEGVGMNEFLPLVIDNLPKSVTETDWKNLPPPAHTQSIKPEDAPVITHNYLWNKVSDYLEPRSIIVSETGTAEFGVFNLRAPPDCKYISQVLWGSIGYSVGGATGAAAADRSRRVYLFVGDGSFQMTAQEVSSMLHTGLTPVIILLNNNGYTIEKFIHGKHRNYNNYQMWKYADTFKYMGAELEINCKNAKQSPLGYQGKVNTRAEFEKAMEQIKQQSNKIHFIEVVMPQFDAPRELLLQVATSENR